MRARIAERSRERLQGGVDQFLIAEIGESQRVGTGDQPVQHAVLADVVTRAFVVNAAAAERFRHEPGARDFLSPKRLIEQDRYAQIMRGTIEIGDVLDHRLAQLLAVPSHRGEPGVGQTHQNQVEVLGLRSPAVHHVELIAAGRGLADLEDPVIEMDIGIDLGLQAVDQLLIAVLDRIQADVAVDIHDEVLERIQPVGIVALGGEIGPRHHLEEAFGDRIVHFLVEQLFAADVRPRMLVVVGADAFVVFDRRHYLRTALAERLDRVRSPGAVFATHARHVVQELAIEVNLLGIHRNGLQTEMLDQLAQGIGAGHRVIVNLGDAGFVHCGR